MSPLKQTLRIAMWSGPRNVSTAMMRAWEARQDTVVVDEPFYAHYLTMVDVDHPGREEVVAAGETDWRKVVKEISGAIPAGKPIFFQKHMAHHLLPHMDRDWFADFVHAFLIRDPNEMLQSFHAKVKHFGLRDTGLPQQVEIFDYMVTRDGRVPPVIDARDLLDHPKEVLMQLCRQLGVLFEEAMLSWPAGPRDSDGNWAKYWYASVEASTGFKPYHAKTSTLPAELEELYQTCMPYYERLWKHRITAS